MPSSRPTRRSLFSIDHGKLIGTILRNVPGSYLRDYRANRGWLTICRGYRRIYDHSKDTDKFTDRLPAETLCALPPGQVQAPNLYHGVELVRPGWRVEMRKLRALISESQARRIERELGLRVFT